MEDCETCDKRCIYSSSEDCGKIDYCQYADGPDKPEVICDMWSRELGCDDG